ncbi:hypothetical protein ACIBCD_32980 [Nocardia brasiliensis]|uniref:hypothetical protein n=1 Tax=Nocardia brasiliensis TaxID=37326 RepID=UPI0024546325|nr:hypothetical protein [Nocardia brasiliensis]
MFTLQSWRRFGGNHAAWIVFTVAALAGLFVLLSVTFADACYYLECRNTVAPFSFSRGVIVAGVSLSLIAGAVLLFRTGRRGRPRIKWAVIALSGVFVSSCSGWQLMTVAPFDDRPALTREARDIATVLGRLPGVHQVSTEIGDMFSAVVVLSEEASAAQAKAVIEAFRDQVWAATDFDQWETELEVRREEFGSSFRAGKGGFAEAPDRAGLWFALTEAFRDEVKWTYRTWAHYSYGSSDQFERRDIGIGDISVKLLRANDFGAVSEAYRRLMREFPALSGARWQIGPAAAGSGSLSVANRYPTELEFTVWQRLNEDRSMPHSVLMASGTALSAQPPPPRVTEQLHSRDLDDARRLAEQHLPIVAELGAPEVDYLVTTDPDDYLPLEGIRRVCLERSLSMTVTNRAYPANDPAGSAGQGFSVRYRQC